MKTLTLIELLELLDDNQLKSTNQKTVIDVSRKDPMDPVEAYREYAEYEDDASFHVEVDGEHSLITISVAR